MLTISFSVFSQTNIVPITNYDQVLLKKGTLTIKEYVEFENLYGMKGEISVLTEVISGNKSYFLRLSGDYENSKYDTGTAVSILDAKEIDSAINAIDFMIKKNDAILDTAPYTEVTYKSNGDPRFGFYVSGNRRRVFFEINSKKTFYYNTETLIQLKNFFLHAKAKINELGGE